jgi:hypothetical protein
MTERIYKLCQRLNKIGYELQSPSSGVKIKKAQAKAANIARRIRVEMFGIESENLTLIRQLQADILRLKSFDADISNFCEIVANRPFEALYAAQSLTETILKERN